MAIRARYDFLQYTIVHSLKTQLVNTFEFQKINKIKKGQSLVLKL